MEWLKNTYKKIKAKILYSILQSGWYSWLVMNVVPYVRFSTYYTKLKGYHYKRGYAVLKKGDILLTIDEKKLTTVLIPGEFSHAALVVDKGAEVEWEVSEMTRTDYTKSTFFDICKEADRVVILRCKDWTQEYITDKVIPAAKALQDAKYDVQFKLGVQALYCSELIYEADVDKKLKLDLSDLAGIGRPYISPTGLYKAENVEIIWDSAKEKA